MPKIVRVLDYVQCSKGTGKGALAPTPFKFAQVDDHSVATERDVLITPCGLCTSLSNPAVLAAKGPVACVPRPCRYWEDASSVVKVDGVPMLHNGATLECLFGGTIKFHEVLSDFVSVAK